VLLSEITVPGQVPYRCLLPKTLDNLLVPVCLSATHVGWGTIRLEPTWMQIGESAGYAAALAVQGATTPAQIDVDRLQRRLADQRVLLSYFNDVDLMAEGPWVPAVQYLGAKGFFGTYNARPNDPLSEPIAREWARTFADMLSGRLRPTARARAVCPLDRTRSNASQAAGVSAAAFCRLLGEALDRQQPAASRSGRQSQPARARPDEVARRLGLTGKATIMRREACQVMYEASGE
jgi:hypothetical protein